MESRPIPPLVLCRTVTKKACEGPLNLCVTLVAIAEQLSSQDLFGDKETTASISQVVYAAISGSQTAD